MKIVQGLAGTGKTHYMAEQYVKAHREQGVSLSSMLVLSFTRHAALAFIEKCQEIDINYRKPEDPVRSFKSGYILTIHSYCGKFVVSRKTGFYSVDQFMPRNDHYARKVKSAISILGRSSDIEKSLPEMRRSSGIVGLEDEYENYIKARGDKIDYDTILTAALFEPQCTRKWEQVFVDEIQDLSLIQHNILEKHVYPNAKQVTIGGDRTQSIYRWRHAYPTYIDYYEGDHVHLNHSYRVPAILTHPIHCIERGMENPEFVSGIQSTVPGGKFVYMGWVRACSFLRQLSNAHKEVLILSRRNKALRTIQWDMINMGILFSQAVEDTFKPWRSIVSDSDFLTMTLLNKIDAAQKLRKTVSASGVDYWVDEFEQEYSEDPWNEPIDTTLMGRMLKTSELWSRMWKDLSWNRDTIRLGEFLDMLDIDRMIEQDKLIISFWGWPPAKNAPTLWNKLDKGEIPLTTSLYLIKEYMQKCFTGDTKPFIKLSTIHAAKGLEAETVMILLEDEKKDANDDLRQLMVNAICRTRKNCIVVWGIDKPRVTMSGAFRSAVYDRTKRIARYHILGKYMIDRKLSVKEREAMDWPNCMDGPWSWGDAHELKSWL